MKRPSPYLVVKALFRMPFGIQKEIVAYFLKKTLQKRPTDHETIWTSFLYFSAKSVTRVSKDNDVYFVDFEFEGRPLRVVIRGGISSDVFVFFQVFIANGYRPLIDFLEAKSITTRIVVDAGANVGYFSLLILNRCQSNLVVALEPEKSNYFMLKKNIDIHTSDTVCRAFQAAIWTHRKTLSIQTSTGKEWASKMSEEEGTQICEAFSLIEIMEQNSIHVIDILKLDVEGTEDALFKNADFLKALASVRVLAIEIHDEFTERSLIHRILLSLDFEFFEKGELTIAWNNRLVHD